MNTSEITSINKCRDFNSMWKLAREQFLKYELIEGISDWNDYDFSIDCAEDQMKFKDMMQIRFIEELTEATEAMVRENNMEHFMEEISDSLNFFLSGYIMLGKTLKELPEIKISDSTSIYDNNKMLSLNELSKIFYPVIYQVGKTCNLLKNRPWSQSNYLCSLTDFNREINILWCEFWEMINKLNISKTDLLDIFWKKVEVNKFRMRTGY